MEENFRLFMADSLAAETKKPDHLPPQKTTGPMEHPPRNGVRISDMKGSRIGQGVPKKTRGQRKVGQDAEGQDLPVDRVRDFRYKSMDAVCV